MHTLISINCWIFCEYIKNRSLFSNLWRVYQQKSYVCENSLVICMNWKIVMTISATQTQMTSLNYCYWYGRNWSIAYHNNSRSFNFIALTCHMMTTLSLVEYFTCTFSSTTYCHHVNAVCNATQLRRLGIKHLYIQISSLLYSWMPVIV